MWKKSRHYTKDVKLMLRKLARDYEPEIIYAGGGYDDNNIFKLHIEEVSAHQLILQRNLDVLKHQRCERYRKQTFEVFGYG